MSFDHNSSWDNFEKVVNSDLSVRDGWNQIIDFHKSIKEKTYWTDLTKLDFEIEQNEIKDWLESTVVDEPFEKKQTRQLAIPEASKPDFCNNRA